MIVGEGEAELACSLARTGRFLVQVLGRDAAAVDALRERIHAAGVYGLASADHLDRSGRLPYAEDLVNLLVLGDGTGPRLAEAARVVCPGGALLVAPGGATAEEMGSAGFERAREVEIGRRWLLGEKPRPAGMDDWTHPRHGADGNAVSLDTLVGTPGRIRWVSGPQQEISNMVSAGGRNFYAGVLARDAFNGLKLWEKALTPTPARGGFGFRAAPGSVQPVSSGEKLFVVTEGKLLALDAATGEILREYLPPSVPVEIVHDRGVLLSIDKAAVHALDVESGELAWTIPAIEPRCAVAGEGAVEFIQGPPGERGGTRLVCADLVTGKVRWEDGDFDWLAKVRRLVHHRGLLACEVSSLSDDAEGNMLHMLSAGDGGPLWSRRFTPWMAHFKQARALFVDDTVWVLEGEKKGPGRCVGLDPLTGDVKRQLTASFGHCFPPIATVRYAFTGEMETVDLQTGKLRASRISKGACNRDAGLVLANGLIYAAPKHCRCWPMLRDYCALAPARPGGDAPPPEEISFEPEAGPAGPPGAEAPLEDPALEWTCYRHDAWRSGGTPGRVPAGLNVLWTTSLGEWPRGAIADDWRGNYFIRGPVGPPVVAGGLVFVTRPDAHQVVALEAGSGRVRWSFTAGGRVDTAPTIHRGLCLFGSKSGQVYCLRADDGRLVWRLRAAPLDERIVAYGQLESPWPVPGSVLVVGDVAFFAAGRQSAADGGILIFAVDPRSGKVRWVRRLDSLPQRNFYASQAQDFENFDLLHREGDDVAMSRWLFDRATGKMSCVAKEGFALLAMGGGGVMFPRGTWSYAPSDEPESWKERPYVRPLMVFRESTLYGSSQERDAVFRRNFDLDGGEKFNTEWFSGWDVAQNKSDVRWRSERLAKGARWSVAPFPQPGEGQQIAAMALTADALILAGAKGLLAALSLEDGRTLEEIQVPPPSWDGLAAAEGRLFLSTQDGRVVCCGAR